MLTFTFLTGIGDGIVYLFYAIPFMLLFPGDETKKVEISIFTMSTLPLLIYSILFSLSACSVYKFKAKIR
jgi:predicted membrane channel-forming protein YqfA (hemolysin III family)